MPKELEVLKMADVCSQVAIIPSVDLETQIKLQRQPVPCFPRQTVECSTQWLPWRHHLQRYPLLPGVWSVERGVQ
jgi:hypothetical protein